MFGRTIEFTMALEHDPKVERTFTYKPSNTQKLNDPKGALFFVCEKGSNIIELSIRITEDNTNFAIGERSKFTRGDTEKAARLIAGAIAGNVAADTPSPNQVN